MNRAAFLEKNSFNVLNVVFVPIKDMWNLLLGGLVCSPGNSEGTRNTYPFSFIVIKTDRKSLYLPSSFAKRSRIYTWEELSKFAYFIHILDRVTNSWSFHWFVHDLE